ncbi:hypothetical protein QE152_g25880 [Popillia japonica]|uniref:Uncharacterized protein n=1 Tax=Popillia japonica TaxID=7064 RepID=A0AAW1K058_POPJA
MPTKSESRSVGIFFCCIRNINPSADSFIDSYKSLIINNFTFTHSPSANCEVDDTVGALTTLKELLTEKAADVSMPANRIAQIQDLTNGSSWRHVPTSRNAADSLSRGMSAQELIRSELWWKGPEWLAKNFDYWPASVKNGMEALPELRTKFGMAC